MGVLTRCAENVRWSAAEDARLCAAICACTGIDPATNSSEHIGMGSAEWLVVKQIFDSLALPETAMTANPRSVAALRSHFELVLSPRLQQAAPITKSGRPASSPDDSSQDCAATQTGNLDNSTPRPGSSDVTVSPPLRQEERRPLSGHTLPSEGSPEAEEGASIGRPKAPNPTSEASRTPAAGPTQTAPTTGNAREHPFPARLLRKKNKS